MRGIMLTAVAAAAFVAGSTEADRAAALMLAATAAAVTGAAHLQKVAVVCSANGCMPVQMSPLQRRRPQPQMRTVPGSSAGPYSLMTQLRRLRSGQTPAPNSLR